MTGRGLIIILMVLAATGFAIWQFGHARYREGVKTCEASAAIAQTKEAQTAQQVTERAKDESNKISDNDLDSKLADLGILRPDKNR